MTNDEIKAVNDIISATLMCIVDTERTLDEIEEYIKDFQLPEDIVEHCLKLIMIYRSRNL